ncbi:MAG: glutamine-hydrolyzing carbamoyl-phosphate synthase small subunit, partial [Alphaproteobacteria bacterium]|nr:glutamine-hydrolyzing carbamoyl-phosphate synthase small subunit [Alphaproteobacteria bacterium]
WLEERKIAGISGIDTRALTRKIRKDGPQNAVIFVAEKAGDVDVELMRAKAAEWPDLLEFNLTQEVSTHSKAEWNERLWALSEGHRKNDKPLYHVVAVDYGAKFNIFRHLAERGCKVTVVPATSNAKDILALKPDGVFLSNGPGDPENTERFSTPVIHSVMEAGVPLFGICLGHQLMGLALGGKTEKMRQGHRGANHPIRNLKTGEIEITSQNHGYVVSHGSLPAGVEATHVSLFDGTIAGLEVVGKPAFAVQYHPESSPGPHDSRYLFDRFIGFMETKAQQAKAS